jgi:hypothetical protein
VQAAPNHRFVRRTLPLFVAALATYANAQNFQSHCIDEEHHAPEDCVITRPKILNVYWDVSRAAWDADAWRSKTPALRNLSVVGFTDDASLAQDLSVSILGADKASSILQRTPISGEVVGVVELRGKTGKASLDLTYTGDGNNERLTVLRLDKGKWSVSQSTRLSSGGIRARLASAGIHAIVVRR